MNKLRAYIPSISRQFMLRMILGIVIGAMACMTLTAYMAYRITKTELHRLQVLQARDTTALSHRYMLWYGEVESVSVASNTIKVLLRNQFASAQEPARFIVRTTKDTIFMYEKLLAEEGAYVGFSSTNGHSIADIQPYMRVAMIIENTEKQNEVIANTVIFGNPL